MRSKEVEYKIKELKRKREYAFRCEYDFATVMLEEIDTALNYIEELEKDNEYEKELRLKYERRYDLLKEGSISKHKIRDKITELLIKMEQLQIQYSNEIHYAYKSVNLGQQKLISEQIKVLNNLLEGE